jgi:Lon protease-like protein
MSFEIPVFPLNVVLFPGMQLPLHIFEPRYQLMVRRCMEGAFGVDRAFGVAMLMAGREGEGGTSPAPVGCLAHISQAAPLPDGRTNLMTIGQRRFHIQSLRTEDEYLIGVVEWLDDQDNDAIIEHETDRTRGALKSYLAAIAENAGTLAPDMMQLEIPVSPFDFSMWNIRCCAGRKSFSAPIISAPRICANRPIPTRPTSSLHSIEIALSGFRRTFTYCHSATAKHATIVACVAMQTGQAARRMIYEM